MTQHASLSPERWARFDLDRQILMIGNEMNRASKLFSPEDGPSRRNAYERVLRLLDLTAATRPKRTLRRELLRWRERVAELYLSPAPSLEAHQELFRVLLLFTKGAARQIPYLLPSRS